MKTLFVYAGTDIEVAAKLGLHQFRINLFWQQPVCKQGHQDGMDLFQVVLRRATAATFPRCVFDHDRFVFQFAELGLRNRRAILQASVFAAWDMVSHKP